MRYVETIAQQQKLLWDLQRPVLVAVSGGPDSMALLYALIAIGQQDIHVGHVDHGWRASSFEEARWLERVVTGLGGTFHCNHVTPPRVGNLEQGAREQRRAFLVQVCRQVKAQAIFLGHHRRDQAETVLKAVLQGDALPFMRGMQTVSHWSGCRLIRPALELARVHVEQFVESEQITTLQDSTNDDQRFLRARMRKRLMPQLSTCFGKQVERPLARVSDEMWQLHDYLSRRTREVRAALVEGPVGFYLPATAVASCDPFELKFVVRSISPCVLPVAIVEEAVRHLVEKHANIRLEVGAVVLHLDRGRLFFQTAPLAERWRVDVCKGRTAEELEDDPIAAVWCGRAVQMIAAPVGSLTRPSSSLQYGSSKLLKRWWNDHKVPAFLRSWVPILMHDDQVSHEFLTGKRRPGSATSSVKVVLTLSA